MKVFTGMMNPLAFDGSVQRASEAASRAAGVLLACPSGPPVPSGLGYAVEIVDLPEGFASRFLEHPVFCKAFVRSARRFKPDVVYIRDHYLALQNTAHPVSRPSLKREQAPRNVASSRHRG